MKKPELKTFALIVKNGKPSFRSEYQRSLFMQFFKNTKDGRRVYVELNRREPSRSAQQNRLYWLYLHVISDDTGADIETLHEYFKQKFLKRGYREVLGERVKVTKSTTNLSKNDFAEYLLEIQGLTSIPIPDTSLFELAPIRIT